MSRPHYFLALLGAFVLAPCLSLAREAPPPTEYLDEQTGATVTVMDKPLVFARERTERAANIRDYINIMAASVNRGGKIDYVLIAYIWSTLDPRYAPLLGTDSLLLVADDRRFALKANGKQPSDLGIGYAVHAPLGQDAKPLVFLMDLPTLRFVATARNLSVQATTDDDSFEYELWEDQRRALGRFVEFMNDHR